MANRSLNTRPQRAISPGDSPAPLTKTCQNCATAKVKCIRTGDVSTCNRCQRLSKDCVYRSARRRFYGNKSDNRIEQLEARVSELLEKQSSDTHRQSDNSPSSSATLETSRFQQTGIVHQNAWARESFYSTPPGKTEDVIDIGLLSLQKAEQLLSVYRASMIYHFPFVMPSPQHTAETLRQSQPYLFLAIMANASYQEMTLQRKLATMMCSQVSRHIIARGEVSFDLLQALLVFVAWSQYHPRPRRHSQLLHLALSILIDLRLERPSEQYSWRNGMSFHPDSFGQKEGSAEPALKDRQRAVLGCYFLTSSSAILLRKLNTLPFSADILKYAENLYLTPEYDTDKYLLALVTVQRLWERIEAMPIGADSDLENHNSSTRIQMKMIRVELDAFRDSLRYPIGELHLLEHLYNVASLYLDQIGLLARTHPISASATFSVPWYSELLRSGLLTANSFFKTFLSKSSDSKRVLTNFEATSTGFFLIVAPKMVVTATELGTAPEITAVLQDIDMDKILDQMLTQIECLVSDDVDFSGDRDIFYHFTKRIRGVKEWYNRRPRTQAGNQGQDQVQLENLPILSLTEPQLGDQWMDALMADGYGWYDLPMHPL
ncbi:hypothetical protein EJ05DRAFT_502069 [Pseudovirgaria hyperparasitica]|uniref:Zn(2)-C6 fungal-type domain-containing protein n=1 Tax=Pseudovirgaria hyperparasitica TaxID=470096 RepID=A0A6A6W3L6_9PEZI|nr:uncharacterized protein EJ05DRAFT_502069 [Pseudovirgaria hyperparasitica]KAF2756566.1 hypothetical protein EJ05DRAFT_502069 [Pseudovirgaria hyperparasitica]